MLNFYNSSIIERNLLEESFDAIQQHNTVQIITGVEKEALYQQTIQTIRTPAETKNFSFENLFKVIGLLTLSAPKLKMFVYS